MRKLASIIDLIAGGNSRTGFAMARLFSEAAAMVMIVRRCIGPSKLERTIIEGISACGSW